MSLPKKKKKKLKKMMKKILEDDVLNEFDALAIIQICLEACERAKIDEMERKLAESFETGRGER